MGPGQGAQQRPGNVTLPRGSSETLWRTCSVSAEKDPRLTNIKPCTQLWTVVGGETEETLVFSLTCQCGWAEVPVAHSMLV